MSAVARHEIIGADGVAVSYLEALPEGGPAPGRPPVVLLHGWPEQAHSWRHQLPALAAAGWHAVAPDLRGFGRSGCPDDLPLYRVDHVAGDVLALLDHLGAPQGVVVGHDWGSMVAWQAALLHPDRTAAVVGMSVPYTRFPLPPTQLFDMVRGDRFFYITYFQEPGVAEAELEADVERTLRMTYWSAAGTAMADAESFGLRADHPMEGTRFLDTMAEPPGAPSLDAMPWFTKEDMAEAVAAYERTGFRGGLSYYRSFDANQALTADLPDSRMAMPSAFLTGSLDPVRAMGAGGEAAQADLLPDFRGTTLVEGAGHWVQQEAPEETNAFLLSFLAGLEAPATGRA